MRAKLALLIVLTLLAPAAWAKVSFNFGGAGGGSIRPGDDSTTCSSTIAGAIRYNSGALGYCNGTAWTPLAAGGASGTTVATGVSGSIQFKDGNGNLAGRSDITVGGSANLALGLVGTNGLLNLMPGDSTYTGYVDFLTKAGTRVGYIGYATTGGLPINTVSGVPILFNPSNTEAMRIQPGGNVGIGTTAPSQPLHVKGWGLFEGGHLIVSDSTALHIYSGNSNFANIEAMDPANSNSKKALALNAYGGNVGIGTIAPSDKLHVTGNVRIDNGTNAAFTIWSGAGLFGGLGSANVVDSGGSSDPSLFAAGSGRNLRFYTNGGERLRILDNGNVGINTASPVAPLEIYGTTGRQIQLNSPANNFRYTRYATAGNARWDLGTESTSESGSNAGSNFYLNRFADDGTYIGTPFYIKRDSGNFGLGTNNPTAPLHVVSGNSYIAKFESSGVETQTQFTNTTTNGRTWSLITGGSGGAFGGGAFGLWDNTGSVQRILTLANGNTTFYGASSNCTIGSGTGATNCTSDIRLKDRIQPIPSALEKISSLRGVTFHWKDPKKAAPEHLGVIAQEVETVFPQAVTTISDTTLPGGAKAVDYAVLVAPLIESVKELKAENDNLRAANGSLSRRLDRLEAASR